MQANIGVCMKQDPLKKRIIEYLSIPGIGKAIKLACDIPLRLRLARTDYSELHLNNMDDTGTSFQEEIASQNLDLLLGENKYISIEEPLYKAIELGELLHCLELWGSCEYAKNCWVTRRGFCQKVKDKENADISSIQEF